MKLRKWLKAHPATLKDVATSTCLLGASAGIVFGVSAAMFKIEYMPLFDPEARLLAATTDRHNYYSEDFNSGWNMNAAKDADGNVIIPGVDAFEHQSWKDHLDEWQKRHPNARRDGQHEPWAKAKNAGANPDKEEGEELTSAEIKARHDIVAMVIDGSTHSTMDRSFNQSLYEGLVDYIKNKKNDHYDSENLGDPVGNNTATSFKPSQDTPTEFGNMYMSAIRKNTVLGLAGYAHATPINNLMVHKKLSDGTVDPFVTGPDEETTHELDETAFILLDSNMPNNQNIASVLFRADQPGFLTGLATCQYFYNNLDIYHDHFQDLEVAAFGGIQITTVIDYIGGFQRGTELFNYAVLGNILKRGPEYYYGEKSINDEDPWSHLGKKFENLVNHSKYKEELEEISLQEFNDEYKQKLYDEFSVKMIKLGDIGTHFSGTFAAGDAIGITKQYLNRGASAIIAVAGPQSLDAAQEIQNQNSKCIVIGVDTAMENSDYQRFHAGCSEKNRGNPNKKDKYMDQTQDAQGNYSSEANGIIKFSAIKDLKQVSNVITRLSLEGRGWDVNDTQGTEKEWPDPKYSICGPGYETCGNILNGLISISWDGFFPLIQALECIEYIAIKGGSEVHEIKPLAEVWKSAIRNYKEKREQRGEWKWEDLDEKYRNNIENIDSLKTFDKTSDVGKALYDNFRVTISILAELFSAEQEPGHELVKILFDRTMTLKEHEGQKVMLDEGETVMFSILEWLNTNMYMIS